MTTLPASSKYSEHDLITYNDAVEALYEARTVRGILWQQPAAYISHIVWSARPTWHLLNVRGLMAKVDAITGTVHRNFLGDAR